MASPRRPIHSRQTSAVPTPVPQSEGQSSRQPPPSAIPGNPNRPIHYTVFIRLPFARNGFEDPPPVEWDLAKDKALWKLISNSSSKDLDWERMCAHFQVSLPFLLQQAAWLYERHFENMRAQMKKLGAGGSATPSPQPVHGENKVGGVAASVPMSRTGSKDSKKVPSIISTQRTTQNPTGERQSSPGTPRSNHPGVSRTPSTTTVTQSRVSGSSSRPPSQVAVRTSTDSKRRPTRAELTSASESSYHEDHDDAHGHEESSESESESGREPSAMGRSQAFRRPPSSRKPAMSTLSSDGDAEDDDDDDDNDSGGYLPFAPLSKPVKEDLTATLRDSPKRQSAPAQQPPPSKPKPKEQPTSSSASSASSAQPATSSNNNGNADTNNRPGPLSPRYRAELEKLSPRHKKSGSEGSRSMGSSFSDLDDASVTQSALEDALLSNMQHGQGSIGIGSRISTLRDALGRR